MIEQTNTSDDHASTPPRYKHCPKCGSELSDAFVAGLDRQACGVCGFVVFRNPLPGVAAIIREGSQVLLVRRGRGFGKGKWTFPSGYVEWHEDVRTAAARETKEEAGLDVEVGEVFEVLSNFHDPEAHSIGMWFLAEVVGGALMAGDDASEAGFFELTAPPDIAFETDRFVLKRLAGRSV